MRMWATWNSHAWLVLMVALKNSLAIPQKVKHSYLLCDSAISLPSIYLRNKTCVHKNVYADVHSSTTHTGQKWKQPKRPSADEWINKMWHIHCMIKRNEMLIRATAWMNPENMLRERSQSQRIVFCMISSIWNV